MNSTQPQVVIMLATLNGEEFLPEQLQSFRDQSYPNWELIASDDGSTDQTVGLIESFAKLVPQRVTLRRGPGQGFWKNFLSMLRLSDIDGEYFAYSDQDDIWAADKLARAVGWLTTIPADIPALYVTRAELISKDGRPLGWTPPFKRACTFQNALLQSIGGGHSMVFNRAAKLVLAAAAREDLLIVTHDWWTYQVVAGIGGTVHFDSYPSLKYRQHGGNIVGSRRGLGHRLWLFVNGRVKNQNEINIRALNEIRRLLSPPNLATLDQFALARRSGLLIGPYLLLRSRVYRQSALETFGTFVGSILGRI